MFLLQPLNVKGCNPEPAHLYTSKKNCLEEEHGLCVHGHFTLKYTLLV